VAMGSVKQGFLELLQAKAAWAEVEEF